MSEDQRCGTCSRWAAWKTGLCMYGDESMPAAGGSLCSHWLPDSPESHEENGALRAENVKLKAALHSHPDREKLIVQLRAFLQQQKSDIHEWASMNKKQDIENERLKAFVDKLVPEADRNDPEQLDWWAEWYLDLYEQAEAQPKTADGVPAVPGMVLWVITDDDGIQPDRAYPATAECYDGHYVHDCYSTRAAAEAAKGAPDDDDQGIVGQVS